MYLDVHLMVRLSVGQDISPLEEKLKSAGVPYTRSMSGRPALFFRDPDQASLVSRP